jgi:hypothetical protein
VERRGRRGGECVGEGARMLGASGPAPDCPRAVKKGVVSVGLVGPPSMHLWCVWARWLGGSRKSGLPRVARTKRPLHPWLPSCAPPGRSEDGLVGMCGVVE